MKTYREMPARVAELSEQIHGGIRLEIEETALLTTPGLRLLVVGSHGGNIARFAAWCFDSSELHMVDRETSPYEFEPVCPETFYKLDILSNDFVEQLSGRVDVILCFMVTHELLDPELGIANILQLLPKQVGRYAWFLDLSAYRWQDQRKEPIEWAPEEYQDHVLADLANVERLGLDDQDRVYKIYETAIQKTGHPNWGKRILTGPHGNCHDIYEVTVGSFE